MIQICGRHVKVRTGTKSQTVNICSTANAHGPYDYIVRLRPPFVSTETLLSQNFSSIQDLVRYLERRHFGETERTLEIPSLDATQIRSNIAPPAPDSPPAAASAKFRAWRDAWDELGAHRRVGNVLELWQAPIPEPWMRSEADTPKRLLSVRRYMRGDLNGIRRGEHEIEYEILVTQFDRVAYLGRPLLDGINAYPLVKDSAGGRNHNVEADLVLLAGPADSALLLVSDVKKTDGNAWAALVQNLRQLRLLTANPACASIFTKRGVKANVVQICGGVIAPKMFYSSRGQKTDSVPHARELSESMLRAHKVKTELLVWDAGLRQLYRYA
jgi:hypothetical protein